MKELLEALSTLRHDTMNEEEVKKQWQSFFNKGYNDSFYLTTLSKVLKLGIEQKKDNEEFMYSLLDHQNESRGE